MWIHNLHIVPGTVQGTVHSSTGTFHVVAVIQLLFSFSALHSFYFSVSFLQKKKDPPPKNRHHKLSTMSESETPIDQNTTGGEPLPNEEIEVPNGLIAAGNDDEDDEDEQEEEEGGEEEEDDDEDEDFMAELPTFVRHRVEKMKELNQKRDEIMEDYLQERAALEKKFSDLCQPLYAERAEIIVGKRDKEIAESVASSTTAQSSEGEDENLVGVPEFWSCCIHNIEAISELVTERDNDCLLYLENVTCDDFEDGKGFELHFHFKENNPYFTNKRLTKRCKFLLRNHRFFVLSATTSLSLT